MHLLFSSGLVSCSIKVVHNVAHFKDSHHCDGPAKVCYYTLMVDDNNSYTSVIYDFHSDTATFYDNYSEKDVVYDNY